MSKNQTIYYRIYAKRESNTYTFILLYIFHSSAMMIKIVSFILTKIAILFVCIEIYNLMLSKKTHKFGFMLTAFY